MSDSLMSIRLIIDRNVQSATVPVRWCISPEVFEEIKEKKIINPYLAIVVSNSVEGAGTSSIRKYTDVYYVPLKNEMELIQFKCSGVNVIHAFVLSYNCAQGKKTAEAYFALDGPDYLNFHSNDDRISIRRYLVHEKIEVVIPKELFAKKSWDYKWVNFLLPGSKPVDECQMRGRRILAYTLQPLLLLLFVVFAFITRSLAAFYALLLCGDRVHFSTAIHPFRDDFHETYEQSDSFYWNTHELPIRFGGEPLKLFATILHPFSIIISLYVGLAICLAVSGSITLLSFAATFFFASLFVPFLLWNIVYQFFAHYGVISSGTTVRPRIEEEVRIKELAEIESVVCETGKLLIPNISDLPENKRTIHLRFWGVKAKICKPFET